MEPAWADSVAWPLPVWLKPEMESKSLQGCLRSIYTAIWEGLRASWPGICPPATHSWPTSAFPPWSISSLAKDLFQCWEKNHHPWGRGGDGNALILISYSRLHVKYVHLTPIWIDPLIFLRIIFTLGFIQHCVCSTHLLNSHKVPGSEAIAVKDKSLLSWSLHPGGIDAEIQNKYLSTSPQGRAYLKWRTWKRAPNVIK